MSSDDALESVAAGATKGSLEYAEDKIKELVIKLRNRDIAFVQDVETINIAKEQRTTSEWKYYQQYITNPDYRILFQLGLTLRRLEKDNKRLVALRDTIVKKYGSKGLHIAQFVQNGLVVKYIGNIMERSPQDLELEIQGLFDNIENTVNFIEQSDKLDKKVQEIVTKILANSPKTYVICSTKSAMWQCEKVLKEVTKQISGYDCELWKTEIKEVFFLNKSS